MHSWVFSLLSTLYLLTIFKLNFCFSYGIYIKLMSCVCIGMYVCVPGKLNVKDEELDEMLNEGKGPINFTVFLTLFGEKLNGTDPEDTILAAFKLFDPNGTGFVNKDEFKRLLMNQADKFTAEEVDQAFALAPIDPTGNIDYKSLCYIITHGDEKEES
uniref:Myosin, light chain 7, regulatory n=1 Tax=Amphiprion percula TaxID=161767 RepID=A0A3P8TGS2_AMPPE